MCLQSNRPFLSCFGTHYESKAKCKVFIKIRFHSNADKTDFHMKSFALSLAFIMRFTATQKWSIPELEGGERKKMQPIYDYYACTPRPGSEKCLPLLDSFSWFDRPLI